MILSGQSKNPIISGSCCVSFETQKDSNIRCVVKRKNKSLKDSNDDILFNN